MRILTSQEIYHFMPVQKVTWRGNFRFQSKTVLILYYNLLSRLYILEDYRMVLMKIDFLIFQNNYIGKYIIRDPVLKENYQRQVKSYILRSIYIGYELSFEGSTSPVQQLGTELGFSILYGIRHSQNCRQQDYYDR